MATTMTEAKRTADGPHIYTAWHRPFTQTKWLQKTLRIDPDAPRRERKQYAPPIHSRTQIRYRNKFEMSYMMLNKEQRESILQQRLFSPFSVLIKNDSKFRKHGDEPCSRIQSTPTRGARDSYFSSGFHSWGNFLAWPLQLRSLGMAMYATLWLEEKSFEKRVIPCISHPCQP
ncbi:hypothetical protein GALMADRAFT_1039103 [Galerina marginata CBS 339.88]|uniref:Uncharacterized protein n=1 Tax=Galerina marginata (strain CBS 339.88) TaxID=685588 RepID=A0A067SF56_GALM3|nr:hypothetical protein GALMADRAFT_1039103 [Galerina marginata CBS 339.88]